MDDREPGLRNPTGAVVSGYLLALLCIVVPLAVLGALFAGVVLARRVSPVHGAAVLVIGVVCAVLRVTVLR